MGLSYKSYHPLSSPILVTVREDAKRRISVTLEQLGLDKAMGWDIRVLEADWRSWVYSKKSKVL